MNADSRQMRCWLSLLLKELEVDGWVNIGTRETVVDMDWEEAGTCTGFATMAIFLIGIGALT